MISNESSSPKVEKLNGLLESAGLNALKSEVAAKFDVYLNLILRWNARINLTAVRTPQEIQTRHIIESIACAQYLPTGIGSLLDFGSGAGFPGVPIALCRPEITVTLAESKNKKASFLAEAVRVLDINCVVLAQRAESLTQEFDCVTLRAVDRMPEAVASASRLVRRGGTLAIMISTSDLGVMQKAAGSTFTFSEPVRLPGSDRRVLAVASKLA
jgi:16S rRNA (guanine527-N7)-methyltransferase